MQPDRRAAAGREPKPVCVALLHPDRFIGDFVPCVGQIGRTFAVLVDRRGIGPARVEKVERQRQRAFGAVVDPADIPVVALPVLARKNRIVADLARDQPAVGPVGRHLPDESELAWVRRQILDPVGGHLDRRIDRQIEAELLGQRRRHRHLVRPGQTQHPRRIVHRP